MYLFLMECFGKAPRKKLAMRLILRQLVATWKPGLRIPISTFRTHNRNRSLSFTNSDQLVNVNKGSRHNEPVTLGERLALMVGHQVNHFILVLTVLSSTHVRTARGTFGVSLVGLTSKLSSSFYLPLPLATESELLRTRRIRLFN